MLLCWLQVRALDGALILRIEDVDRSRVRAGATDGILRDLRWLGFDWDEGPDVGGASGPYAQSERSELYEQTLRRLADRTFACTCTRKQVRRAAGVPPDFRGEVPYLGACRSGASDEGGLASVRVRVEPGEVSWHDLALGPSRQEPASVCGDFILRTKAGDYAYQLACVADDVAMGITHVLRGADLVDSTGRQLLLWRWLDVDPPLFAHTPLRTDASGARLAKSRGSLGLTDLRDRGDDPRLLLGRLAFELGLLDQEGEAVTPAELLPAFAERRPGLIRPA
jgi:glutamyl-tRNA synthetase